MSSHSQSSQRRQEYFQEHWQNLILSSEEVVLDPQQQQQQEPKRLKKKKCHGNRKLQRFRAKLRKQGLNTETITTMINEYNNNPSRFGGDDLTEEQPSVLNVNREEFVELHIQEQQQQQPSDKHATTQMKTDKRKRKTRPPSVATSEGSQVSIVQPSAKRQRRRSRPPPPPPPTTTAITTTTVNTTIQSKVTKKLKSNNKPNYLNVPDYVFKTMLSTAFEGAESIIQLLDTPEKLKYARDYAQLVNNLFYLKLKQNFWDNYSQVAINTGIWSLNISKQIIKQNDLLHRMKFVTQENVEKRRKAVIEELKQAENELMKHKQLAMDNYQSIGINRLSTVIPAFVRKGQHKLSTDFQRRKLLLHFDAQEYYLIHQFYSLKPSEDQIISAKLIWQATVDKQQLEEYVAILKQRIYTKRLPASFRILDHSIDGITEQLLEHPFMFDKNKCATLSSKRRKTIAQCKYDLIVINIITVEELIRNHTNVIVNEKKKLTATATAITTTNEQVPPLPKSLVTILDVIARRQSAIIQRTQLLTQQKISFFRPCSNGGYKRGGWHRRSDILNTISHILPSSPIIEVASSLSSGQLAFLVNGPKYIPVCQSRFSHLPIDTIITQEYQKLIESFKVGLNDNYMSITDERAKNFFTSIEKLLREYYTKPLPPKLLRRAQYDHQMVKNIQRIVKQQNIIVRKTDKSKVLYLGSAESYHQKSLQYMQKTNAYIEIENGINPYMNHLYQVLAFIDPLLKKKAIDLKIWKQYMRPNANTIELAHLYFIPKPHKIGTPLRPIVSSIRAAATGVSHFLDLVLRPLFDRVARQTTFINGIHLVRRLELYRDLHRLSSTTTFITFDVVDLYTMIPRNGALLALQQFLRKYAQNNRINGMTIDILMRMARLVLDTNCFAFGNKYYQQIRGGAMGSPFTMTLANIYMLKWEQPLIEHQKFYNELYGRYIDDVFMTTNLPLDQINILLDRANTRDENIRIHRSIGSTIQFLDVSVHNNQGQLKTSVFRKPAAEPYIVPFLSDHPRHIHRNVIRGALFRAVRLCSDVEDFDKERLNIELTLLLNGYPPRFISHHFKRFFQRNNVTSLMEELNNDVYRELHDRLILQPTRRERERQQQQRQENIVSDQVQLPSKEIQQRQNWNKKEICVYFTFENGPMLSFQSELYRLWKKHYIYDGSPMNDVTLKIRTRTNKSLSQLLIKKKPPKSMLINVDPTNIK